MKPFVCCWFLWYVHDVEDMQRVMVMVAVVCVCVKEQHKSGWT